MNSMNPLNPNSRVTAIRKYTSPTTAFSDTPSIKPRRKALKEGGAIMGTVFQELLDRGKEIGVKEGKEIGVKEGDEKAMWRFALSCIKKGIDIGTIADLTDLPIERIELLKKVIQPESA